VSTYTIGEVADRSGFTASALRYYEGIGLVTPSTRTDAGYRVYDDHTLARLAFIARAKQLGCSLNEIIDLVAIWDGEQCGPVQRHFHGLVTEKIAEAQRQTAELVALTGQLQTAAAQLSGQPTDGPCGDDCACVSGSAAPSTSTAVTLGAKPADPPIACTLAPGAMLDRLAEWQAVLAHARSRITSHDGALRVEFDDDVVLRDLARLVAAEQSCCAFFSFAITVDRRGVALEVRASAEASDIVKAVFGEPRRRSERSAKSW
jgi:DNA-binding transcriptional MerR regulator